MIVCKWDVTSYRGLTRFGGLFPEAEAVQIVYGSVRKNFATESELLMSLAGSRACRPDVSCPVPYFTMCKVRK